MDGAGHHTDSSRTRVMGETRTADAWRTTAWREEADAWIIARLAELGIRAAGPIEQPHVRPWATVLRLPTDTGAVFFKANEAALRHEAAVVSFVATRHPDLVPAPLAVDLERGWMLMEDAGHRLRELIVEERGLRRWLVVLPAYARLQIDLAPEAEALIGLGLPDRRLATLPAAFDALLEDVARPDARAFAGLSTSETDRLRHAARGLSALCADLAAFAIPETIQHDDLNDGQVFVRDGRYALLDWADACVSHPFFSLSVALEGVIAWGVDDVEDSEDTGPYLDAYLEPFARERSRAELLAAARIGLRLGWICRAVNGHAAGAEAARATGARLRMFLDGRP